VSARRTDAVQSARGRQSASVRASSVAPAAIAARIPVSAAAPVPFCGSSITRHRVSPCRAMKRWMTSAEESVEALSTNTASKSPSSCTRSASSVGPIPAASLKTGTTTASVTAARP